MGEDDVAEVTPSTTFVLFDTLYWGRLTEYLTQWRAEGKDYRAITEQIRKDSPNGMTVHYSTVQRWCEERGIVKGDGQGVQ